MRIKYGFNQLCMTTKNVGYFQSTSALDPFQLLLVPEQAHILILLQQQIDLTFLYNHAKLALYSFCPSHHFIIISDRWTKVLWHTDSAQSDRRILLLRKSLHIHRVHELRHRLVAYVQNPRSMHLVQQFPKWPCEIKGPQIVSGQGIRHGWLAKSLRYKNGLYCVHWVRGPCRRPNQLTQRSIR